MRQVLIFFAVYGIVVGATSCSSGSTSLPATAGGGAGAGTYTQIERLARPAVKEATQPFAQHDDTNRTSPAAQPYSSQSLYQAIGSFVSTVAKRDAATTSTIQAILVPDEIAVDLSQPTTQAAYLGVESKGATGSAFGGRGLTDDVIDADLGVIFGNTLAKLGAVADDGRESPCLTTDNVGYSAATKRATVAFPYAGTPN